MIIAAFGNVYGHSENLDKILRAIEDEGIMTVIHTGNLVVGHPKNQEVIHCIQGRELTGVQGIQERNLVKFIRKRSTLEKKMKRDEFDVLESAFDECSSEELEYLHRLPSVTTIKVDGVEVTIGYGSLSSHKDDLTEDDALNRFERLREMTSARIVVLGGSSDGYIKEVHKTLIVHPGNVCGNAEGMGEYAIINTEDEEWHAEIRTVPL